MNTFIIINNKYFTMYKKHLYFYRTIFICAWKAVILCRNFEKRGDMPLIK